MTCGAHSGVFWRKAACLPISSLGDNTSHRIYGQLVWLPASVRLNSMIFFACAHGRYQNCYGPTSRSTVMIREDAAANLANMESIMRLSTTVLSSRQGLQGERWRSQQNLANCLAHLLFLFLTPCLDPNSCPSDSCSEDPDNNISYAWAFPAARERRHLANPLLRVFPPVPNP